MTSAVFYCESTLQSSAPYCEFVRQRWIYPPRRQLNQGGKTEKLSPGPNAWLRRAWIYDLNVFFVNLRSPL